MKGQRYVHKSKWKIIWVIDDDGSRKPFVLDEKGSLDKPYNSMLLNETGTK